MSTHKPTGRPPGRPPRGTPEFELTKSLIKIMEKHVRQLAKKQREEILTDKETFSIVAIHHALLRAKSQELRHPEEVTNDDDAAIAAKAMKTLRLMEKASKQEKPADA